MSEQEITISRKDAVLAENTAQQAIPITIINNSSISLVKSIVTVKDMDVDPNAHDQVRFGLIPAGSRETRNAHLPTGLEWTHFVITPAEGDDIVNWGSANNATAVRITITD